MKKILRFIAVWGLMVATCLLSVWTPPCAKTRGAAARARATCSGGSGTRRARRWSRARTGAARALLHGGSAAPWGAAYLSNVWYPDRLNTFSSGLEQGAATIGLDLLGNIGSEFWPDLKHRIFRRP